MNKSLEEILLEYGTINRKNAHACLIESANSILNNNWKFISGIGSHTKPLISNTTCDVIIGTSALYYDCLPNQCTKAGYVLAIEHMFHEQRHVRQIVKEAHRGPEVFQTQTSRDMTNLIRRRFVSLFYPFAYLDNYEHDPGEMDAENYALEQTRKLFQTDEFVTAKEADQILYDLMLYFHPEIFTDIREFAKDRLSRIFSAGRTDHSSGITKEDIANGITDGIVRFIVDPNMEEGTVCEIGENWFYFGGQTAEEENPDDYLAHTPMSDIVREIFETLESIKDLDDLEYQYYEAIFRETGSCHKAEPFPITRNMAESHEHHVSQIISRVNGCIIRAKELDKHECIFPCDRNKEEDAPFYEDVKKRFVRAGYSFRIDTENHGVQKIMW